MKLYRFSPIQNEQQLLEAIAHIHFACFELCKKAFDKYLPVAGNIGVFCHYPEEYKFLTSLREKLTEQSNNFNQKYFLLHQPMIISAQDDIPETTYTYLYIRQPDPYRAQTGDVDFVLPETQYNDLKQRMIAGEKINGARVFDRADLDMIELCDPDLDALGYITTKTMSEKVRIKQVN